MQVLGKINTREDRLLVFPNVLQHRVLPFELDDLTKPGHRKLLALFLVDPGIRIPSTANVPPQQRDWWARRVRADNESALGGLPPEMFDQVMQGVEGFPMTTEDAKRVREELMDERKVQGAAAEEEWSKEGYCFCEH